MIDRPWFKSYDPGLPHSLQPYPEISMLDVLRQTVQKRPDAEALVFKGRSMSYAQVDAYSDAFGAALLSLGVKKGERVMMLLPNSPQAVITQLGVWKAGAIICPVNPLYTEWELEHALIECGAQTVVVLNPYYNKVKALQPRTQIQRVIAVHIIDFLPAHLALLFRLLKEKKDGYRIELQAGDTRMSDLLSQFSGKRSPVEVKPGDPAILLFSGGTTGIPKAVLAAHRSLVISSIQLAAYASAVANEWVDRMTLVMPLFHVYGNMGMNTALLAHWPMVIVPNPRDLDDLISTLRRNSPGDAARRPHLIHRTVEPPRRARRKSEFQIDQGLLLRCRPSAGGNQTRFRSADRRPPAGGLCHDRNDPGSDRLPHERRLQRRLDRHPAPGCGCAHRRSEQR